jgi:hypothetical protein
MLQTTTLQKNNYHPLVPYFYRHQLLSTDQQNTIPRSTLFWWQKREEKLLFGYDFVSGFSADLDRLTRTQKYRILRKTMTLRPLQKFLIEAL